MDVRIVRRLAELRRAKGYSQEALAHELGLSRQAVSKWERGESAPDTENLIALARLYGMTLDDLLGFGGAAVGDGVAGSGDVHGGASKTAFAAPAGNDAAPATAGPTRPTGLDDAAVPRDVAVVPDARDGHRPQARKGVRAVLLVLAVLVVLSLAGWVVRGVVAAGSSSYEPTTLEEGIDRTASFDAAAVRDLAITWRGGSVEVRAGSGDEVTVRYEVAAGRYDMDPSKVTVGFDNNNRLVIDDHLPESDNGRAYPAMRLTVTVPYELAARLGTVEMHSTSASWVCDGLACNDLMVETVGGELRLDGIKTQRATIDTVSAPVALSGAVTERLEAKTVSGAVHTSFADGGLPRQARIETVSGDVALGLGEGADATVTFDTVSGELESELSPARVDEGTALRYGNGTAQITVDTTSGFLIVR